MHACKKNWVLDSLQAHAQVVSAINPQGLFYLRYLTGKHGNDHICHCRIHNRIYWPGRRETVRSNFPLPCQPSGAGQQKVKVCRLASRGLNYRP
jgi:hypothetical protein